MPKGDDQQRLSALAGKAAYASFRVFGIAPLRPGDDWYGLKAVRASGDTLELVFDWGGEELPVALHGAAGVEVQEKTLTVRQADRVTFGARLEVRRAGNKLALVLDGEKQERPFAGEPAFEAC